MGTTDAKSPPQVGAARRAQRAPEKTLEDLRPLLVGPEQRRIEELEQRLDRLSEFITEALPDAVVASRSKSEALAWAFEPLLDKSVREIVRKDPGSFAEAISPAIGSAIRSSIASAIRAMLERFNQALNRSLSVESVRWRIEARRTGRPFAEVVLLRTLVYRVEQVFLIHRQSGLLLQQVTAEDVPSQDPDQVAGMLSALETFAHEAFREEARLERFRVGDLVGWVEHGPSALLVAIVRGTAPEEYEETLKKVLERAHLEHGAALTDFRGDTLPFLGTEDLLADCLEERRKVPRRLVTPQKAAIAMLALLVTVLVLWLGWARREEHKLASYASALRGEPGLFITAAERRGGRIAITGLRDPLAADPALVLARKGLPPKNATLQFGSFYSLDPPIIERRAREVLRPPPGVWLTFRDGTLRARGLAPERWLQRARSAAVLLPGVQILDDTGVFSEESVERVRAAAEALERRELIFPRGSIRLSADQRPLVDAAAANAKQLLELAPEAGLRPRIVVVGYADPSGSAARNEEVSEARAENVAAELRARGIAESDLDVRGGGVRVEVLPPECTSPGPEGGACRSKAAERRARSATFQVETHPATEG